MIRVPAPLALPALAALLAAPAASPAEGEAPPLLRSGDRVVLIGETLIERARLHGHLETALQVAAGPEVEGLSVRNLGWSGDTVFGDARSYFGPPQEGRERLASLLEETAPDVALICYGTGAAMSTDAGWTREPGAADRSAGGLEESLAVFLEGYAALLDLVAEASGDSLREIVLVAPPPLESLPPPLPDQRENNRRLAAFRDGIRDLAAARGLRFADLFAALGGERAPDAPAEAPLTVDGVHHGEEGHRALALALVRELGYEAPAALSGDDPALAELREAVVEKDRLFFHRWRPANETYLFLFRKHEQGQNAKEIPMFDPLVSAQEARIGAARAALFASLRRDRGRP